MLKFEKMQKIISFLCVATLLIATVSAGFIFKTSAETINSNVWDGTTATAFAGGTGTANDPYQITNGAELAYMLESSTNERGKYYKLMNDIYLNDVSDADWTNGTNLNEWFNGKQFFGFLDGGNYTVNGIYYPDTADTWVGLIPQILAAGGTTAAADGSKASIKNLGIRNSLIQGAYAGAFVGKPDTDNGILIENCFADETVTVKGVNREGGLVASSGKKNFVINNCYYTGNLSGTASQASAAILGYIDSTCDTTSKITNCYAVVTNGVSYIVSKTNGDKITYQNVYGNRFWYNYTGIAHVNEANMLGSKALSYMSGFDFENVYMAINNAYPVLRGFDKVWDGTVAYMFAGGTGTANDPYQITNGAELAYMLESSTNERGKYYKLMNDIYLNDVSDDDWTNGTNLNEWLNGKQFFGFLDGGNYTVNGIYYPDTADTWVGLIPQILAAGGTTAAADGSKASIKNLGIRNSLIQGAYAGAFVGKPDTDNGILIENCFADETVTVKGVNREGGLVASSGKKNFIINNCYYTGNLSGTASQASAAILGYIDSTCDTTSKITNCYAVVTNGVSYIVSKTNGDKITYQNVYGNRFWYNYTGIAHVNEANMLGSKALSYMSGFDFVNVWKVGASGKYPTLNSFPIYDNGVEEEETKVWDGNIAASYAGGTGTAEDPFLISNGSELALILNSSVDGTKNKYFELTNDIYLNDVENPDWQSNNPNEWYAGKTFYGHLDGANHIIYGVYYADGATGWAGLVPVLYAAGGCTASIKNIGVKDSKIEGTRAGGLVGKPDSSNGITIDNCFVDNTSVCGVNAEGGIIAYVAQKNISVSNCYTKVTFNGTATEGKGGLMGFVYNPDNTIKFINCYAITPENVPVSYANSTPLYNNSYGNVAADKTLQGMNILTDINDFYGRDAYSKMQFLDFVTFVPQLNDTPVLRSFCTYIEGDIDGSEKMDAQDLVLIRKYLLKKDSEIEVFDFAAADMRVDGKINLVDLVALKKATVE